ncbi:MAG: UvrD-helicase domain-containing protein [Oscillospiraceae bacterium]|nr:UvrD-helicase domain-containing protein [Oscillospiraceae bacterium]
MDFKERFISARRAIIKNDFRRLNDMQFRAAMTTEGALLILAGAGSGKTTVLINRIANLLKYGRGYESGEIPARATDDDLRLLEYYALSPDPEFADRVRDLCAVEPVEPWRVIAITFTNKAANELKSRLESFIGPEAGDVWAMTFHSACVRILRRDIDRLGYDRDFTIYDTSDSQSTVKHVLKELDLDDKTFPPRTVLSYISQAKDMMVSPEEFTKSAGSDIRRQRIGEIYELYTKKLREANALDFDDLILMTVKLLTENDEVREYYQRKFKYVLIDEYQDTNRLQYLLAENLAGGYRNICVVGDDDQSIYRFRGATIENILSFEDQYKDAKVIRLEQNYRSTGNILEAANAVIKNNLGRKGKNLWTESEMGEKLCHYMAGNEYEEAQYIAGKILAGFSAGGSWSDYAVLYRMNAQSNQLEFAMKRNGIPYKVFGGTRFFDRAEVKDMLAYLCVIDNPSDDLRLLRIIANPPRGIGAKTVETAQQIAASEGRSVFYVMSNCLDYDSLKRGAAKLLPFTDMIRDLREKKDEMPLDQFFDLVAENSGYLHHLEEKDREESRDRVENVRELKSNIVMYMKDNFEPSLSGFLAEVALYSDLQQYDESESCVTLMTIHSAKGLEFDTVFIAGAEDGIFPGTRAIGEPEEMEEERRLCYVAITRAKKQLYITSARQRMLFGRTQASQVSRFVKEIPDEYIDRPAERRTYGHSDPGFSFGGFETRARSQNDFYGAKKETPAPKKYDFTQPKKQSLPDFRALDRVRHKAFGEGTITRVTAMGADALVEIEFDGIGKKRLMLKSAAGHMEKI